MVSGGEDVNPFAPEGIDVFSTCPPSTDETQRMYSTRVRDIARWSEQAGCRGILVYTDNRLLDPWLVARLVIERTEQLCPPVAVQPVYMHPYAVAKLVSSFAYLHERRVYLNMVAGGFVNDLKGLADETDHDDRYRRLVEYTTIVMALLRGEVVSGSSPAGLAAARALDATAVKYPERLANEPAAERDPRTRVGIRIGIFTRPTTEEAWEGALARFPESRKGQITHGLAMRVTDSSWHRQLSELGKERHSESHPYWLGAFENYKTFCPY